MQLVQEPERTVSRQAEAQSSRAPLQVQSSNVQVPAMAQAVQASIKPVHQTAGLAAARLPLPQHLQVKHSFLRSHLHHDIASQLPEITSAPCYKRMFWPHKPICSVLNFGPGRGGIYTKVDAACCFHMPEYTKV